VRKNVHERFFRTAFTSSAHISTKLSPFRAKRFATMTSHHRLLAHWLIAAVMLSACFQSSHAAKQRRESSEYSLWSCAHDMVTYCNDVVPGDLRMKDCLVYHRKLLLPVCREKKTTYREIVPQSCESDAAKHCDQENIHDKTRCLRVKFARLSQACLDALPLNPPFESLPIELKHTSVDSECSISLFKECRQTVGGKDLADCVQHRVHALSKTCGLVAPTTEAFVSEACRGDADKFCSDSVDPLGLCLRAKVADISVPCAVHLRVEDLDILPACSHDLEHHCVHAMVSREEAVKCLVEREMHLKQGCTAHSLQIRPREDAEKKKARGFVESPCNGDVRRLCAGVPPGGGRIISCLESQLESLSDRCSELLTGKPRVSKRPPVGEWDQQMANQMEEDMRKALGSDANDTDDEPPAAAKAQAEIHPGVRFVHRRKYSISWTDRVLDFVLSWEFLLYSAILLLAVLMLAVHAIENVRLKQRARGALRQRSAVGHASDKDA
jgi:hypothetical protein